MFTHEQKEVAEIRIKNPGELLQSFRPFINVALGQIRKAGNIAEHDRAVETLLCWRELLASAGGAMAQNTVRNVTG